MAEGLKIIDIIERFDFALFAFFDQSNNFLLDSSLALEFA